MFLTNFCIFMHNWSRQAVLHPLYRPHLVSKIPHFCQPPPSRESNSLGKDLWKDFFGKTSWDFWFWNYEPEARSCKMNFSYRPIHRCAGWDMFVWRPRGWTLFCGHFKAILHVMLEDLYCIRITYTTFLWWEGLTAFAKKRGKFNMF